MSSCLPVSLGSFFYSHPTPNPSAGTARPSFKWHLLIQHLIICSIITLVPATIFPYLLSHSNFLTGLFNPILGSLTIVVSSQSSQNAPHWLKVNSCPAQSSPMTPHNSHDPVVLPSTQPCCPSCCVSITTNLFPLRGFQLSASFFLQWFCPRSLQQQQLQKKKTSQLSFLYVPVQTLSPQRHCLWIYL